MTPSARQPYDVTGIRAQFPALALMVNGHKAAFMDAPGGTQTPQRVIDRMVRYLIEENANAGGEFETSRRNDAMIENAREVFADFMGCDADEVAFCHNSTTINFKLALAMARDMKPGDEILITDIDHEANRGPWEILGERGIVIRNVRFDPATYALDMDHFRSQLSDRTRVVAFNLASNAVGTMSDAAEIVRLARSVGAVTVADAVHYALHAAMDLRKLGVDYLFCSAYKFFGPHIGILYGRRELIGALRTLRVGAQDPAPPWRFETGTLNHEGIAGAAEAVEFLADLGRQYGDPKSAPAEANERRRSIVAGLNAIEDYEQPLATYFKKELRNVAGLTLHAPPPGTPCTSTISFTLANVDPKTAAQFLGERGIFVWAGNFYAVKIVRALGLEDKGGLIRFGLAPYNTREEIDRALEAIRKLATTG